MKHTIKITYILVLIFFCAQLIGLAVVNQYVDIHASSQSDETIIKQTAYDLTGVSPPPIENQSFSFIYIIAAVIIGTILILLIVKFNNVILWKFWFFLSIILTLLMALTPFINKILDVIGFSTYSFVFSIIVVLVLAFYRVYKPNIYIHNITELFVYGGLAAILVPILNLFSIVILLLLISAYDAYAVWKSKHMIEMAKFQKNSKMFAGLMFYYDNNEKLVKPSNLKTVSKKTKVPKKAQVHSAILGGGDIAFPLLFSGTVLTTTGSFLGPLIISITTSIALYILYLKGEKNKFYPAMPFLTVGCFLGYAISWLFGLV